MTDRLAVMNDPTSHCGDLGARFEEHRRHLLGIAYRMLGSHAESEDVVQDTWLRLSRMTDEQIDGIDNLAGWLTTTAGRLSLDRLRSRSRRRTESLEAAAEQRLPDPVVRRFDDAAEADDPAAAAELAESVSLALLVVLETLPPAERLAFVLHDTFAVPFDDIAPIVQRSPEATRQLASRARRRLRDTPADLESRTAGDVTRQREVVEAWIAAARGGDFEALVSLLDPDAVLQVDSGRPRTSRVIHGAETIARNATSFRRPDAIIEVVLVNGAAGLLAVEHGRPLALGSFAFGPDGRIVAVSIIADRQRLGQLGLPEIGG
ncbi:sigma-70 family RNA polymerase sigma factor [Desertimonas flava]|uniref:sigma-70 family RNA polymerase sigma factor n=1 Tax=Desertimonas flava TaxID=2064846 RepID=UPI001968E072|nr:sigma-70 family RNA polymerase sigma factor [Desertimonas flava]